MVGFPSVPDPAYVELQVTTNYSFLRGASHIEELFAAAQALGLAAVAITDHNTLAGIARAHARAEEIGLRLIVGCRLDLSDSLPVLVYPTAPPMPGCAGCSRWAKAGPASVAVISPGRTSSLMATA